MKNLKPHFVLSCCAIVAAVYLTSCSKEQLIPEYEPVPVNHLQVSAITTDALDSLTVSTFYKGSALLPLYRIGSSSKQTLFVTTARRNSQGTVIKITPQGTASTFTNGLENPVGIKAAKDGSVYVADFWGDLESKDSLIVKISPNGTKTLVTAPDGSSLSTRVFGPRDVAIADDNTTLYVLNTGGNTVLRINNDKLFDVAGKTGATGYVDGIGYAARLNYPSAMKLSSAGNLFFVDDKLDFNDTYVNMVTPDGTAFGATGGRSIRKINLATREVTTIYEATGGRRIMDIAVSKKDQNFKPTNTEGLFAVFSDNTISYINTAGVEVPLTSGSTQGMTNGRLRSAKFGFLTGISIHENFMDVVDMSNYSIRRIIRKK